MADELVKCQKCGGEGEIWDPGYMGFPGEWDKCMDCNGKGYNVVEAKNPNDIARPKPKEATVMMAERMIKFIEGIIDDSIERGYMDEDTPQWSYETIMAEVYGEDIWRYVNYMF